MPSLVKFAEEQSLTAAQEGEFDALLRSTTLERLNNPNHGYPVLIYATKSGNLSVIRKLLQKGVDKNIEVNVGKYGRTPVERNALEIAGSTRYKRVPPGGVRPVVDDDVKIDVILELGGADDDSWRKYAGQSFQDAFDDAVAVEVAMPVGESADVLEDAGKKHKYRKHKYKNHKRKSHKRKSHKRKSHKRKSHKRKSHKRKASRGRRKN
jgi:hypothetical protein